MENLAKIPIATYRLQFNSAFTFQDASALVEYLHALGISHYYASPLLKAKPASTHGYDVVDHTLFQPELGARADFESLLHVLHQHHMGMFFDIVPNHMFILDSANKWWYNVLENGPASPFADYFDIDWHPPRQKLNNKVLLPILEQQYGDALEKHALKIIYQQGGFFVEMPFTLLPTDPKSWIDMLEQISRHAALTLSAENQQLLELQSIITALSHLPATCEVEKGEERQREKEIIKRRLNLVVEASSHIFETLKAYLAWLNGQSDSWPTGTDPRPHLDVNGSCNALETFLDAQPYRLCYWRVANEEINFRRFFDVFEYAGLRTEKLEVLTHTHNFVFDLMQKNLIDGLRIDHIDGLWDPEKYLEDLQAEYEKMYAVTRSCDPVSENKTFFYVVVEKILTGNEQLRKEWLVQGTVGYDFLNLNNALFVDQSNKKAIFDVYQRFTGCSVNLGDLKYECKKLILLVSMSSELYMLSRRLDRIAEQHRHSRDFTAETLRAALRDIIACFPVYRSYIRAFENSIHDEDRKYILTAISAAKRFNPVCDESVFEFIQSVLLLEHPKDIDADQKKERLEFVMRFQQLTGPVMAKGIEDTLFYRFYPLASLNEVGNASYNFGVSIEAFHKKNSENTAVWPYAMLASSTHDTKRSEDMRARINVLSEIPAEWEKMLTAWSTMNMPFKVQEGDDVFPDANEEYLLYQTLLGSWPLEDMTQDLMGQYVQRLQTYMDKALKEAKIHTSWINPYTKHDLSVQQFVQKILNLDNPESSFLTSFKDFASKIISAGMLNALSQTLLKLTSPGVPDIYQGNEIWDFSLVDPDNRRPVDFNHRKILLGAMRENMAKPSISMLQNLMENARDGRIKMFVTAVTLQMRHKFATIFTEGLYIPLEVEGDKQKHIIAFSRTLGSKCLIVVAARFLIPLMSDSSVHIESKVWGNTRLVLPGNLGSDNFQHLFTGESVAVEKQADQCFLSLENVLRVMPLAILESNI